MCGIFALFQALNPSVYVTICDSFERHCNYGQSRGPENSTMTQINENILFGFHRLAINGLDEQSNQPLCIDGIYLICNGEIYNYKSIYKAVTAHTLHNTSFDSGILRRLQKGYNHQFSGDVLLIPNPSIISGSITVTTHGAGYNYDSHVPIICYGKGIKKGVLKRKVAVTGIAPTLSNMLKISFPNSSTGSVITEILE